MAQAGRHPVMHGLLLAMAAIVLPTAEGRAQPPRAESERLVAARRNWADYERTARTWSLRSSSTNTSTSSGRSATYPEETLVRGNGRCFSIESSDGTHATASVETNTRLCRVIGPRYNFNLSRSPGNAEWALTSVTDHRKLREAIARGEIPADRRTIRDEIESDYLLLAVAIDNLLASQMVGHEFCRTERFAPLSPAPDAPVEWRFTVDPAKRPAGMRQVESGSVLFEPANRWVVREYTINNRNGRGGISTIHRALKYQPGPGGYPVPSEKREELVSDDRSVSYASVAKIELVPQAAPPDDKEFTLSAYGLPEEAHEATAIETTSGGVAPVGRQTAAEPSSGWYYWLAAAGVALVIVSVIIRYVRTRGQSETADAAT